MKVLTLTRKSGWYARWRALRVVVDDVEVARIKHNQRVEITVSDQADCLWGAMDWATTDRVNLKRLVSGQTISFEGYFSWNSSKQMGLGASMPFRISVH